MSTILITGCSSGFGLETAKLFLGRDWDVVATMRAPHAELLPASDRLRIVPLDVTDPDSIAEAGTIDVLVNNAGLGAPTPIELTAPETARTLFGTNTLGTLAMVQALLPAFRERRAGVIINVTSTVTLTPDVAEAIWRAATDPSAPLRIPAGADAEAWMAEAS